MRALLSFSLSIFMYLPTGAAALDYATCVDRATVDPEQTVTDARAWWYESGDLAARHCEVIALTEAGALRTAALLLDDLIAAPDLADSQRIPLLTQSAQIWSLYGDRAAAMVSINAALDLSIEPELLVERASLFALADDHERALSDLDLAIQIDPRHDEALALRSAARRKQGDLQGALDDALVAIEVRPQNALAWVELGSAQVALGQRNGARRSFLKAIDLAPGGPIAALARGALQDMDGG